MMKEGTAHQRPLASGGRASAGQLQCAMAVCDGSDPTAQRVQSSTDAPSGVLYRILCTGLAPEGLAPEGLLPMVFDPRPPGSGSLTAAEHQWQGWLQGWQPSDGPPVRHAPTVVPPRPGAPVELSGLGAAK